MAKKTYPTPTPAMQRDSSIIANAFKKYDLLKHDYLKSRNQKGKVNTLLVNKYVDAILKDQKLAAARSRLSKINEEDPLKTIKVNSYNPSNPSLNVQGAFTFKPFTYIPPLPPPPIPDKKELTKAQNEKIYEDAYNKKYPPIILNNPNDPRIGWFTKEGNKYIYVPLVKKEILIKPTKNQIVPTVEQMVTPAKVVAPIQKKVVAPVVPPAPATPSKLTAYKSQTVMYPDGSYELRQVPYYTGNDKGTWTQGTKLNPPGVINATDLTPEEVNFLQNKNKLQPVPTTNQQFLDGGPLINENPPNLNKVMNAPTESFNKFKPNSVLAYNPYEKIVNTLNPSAYVKPNYHPQGDNYKYGFLGTSEGNIYGGAGYGIPKYGLEGTVFGTTPSSKNPYFKGFYNAGISKQFNNNKIGLSVGAPITGYTDETGFNANKLEVQPQINFKRTFLDGGPLVDKTNHGKLLNSVYASALGNYYADGGYLGDKGNTQVYTDKAGNTTTKFTKPDGTEYIKVKNAKGKEYNKTIPAMKPDSSSVIGNIIGNITNTMQNVANPINSDILKIGESVSGGGYNKAFAGSGTPFVISHKGQDILSAATDGTYCSGYTCGVAMKTMQQRGLLDNMTPEQLRDFQKTWYGVKDFEKGKSETLSTKALEDYNLGKHIEHKEAKPGDIAQIWRNNGSGHSVIFKDWVTDDKGNRIGIKYRSSQSNTKGIGDRTEMFDTKINPKRIYVARLNDYSEGGLIHTNKKSVTPIAVGAAASQDTEFADGGQFTRPYSLPEDSFKQGGNNLHNSVYASSMEQYPAVYEYGGPMTRFYASNVEEPATIGKDLAYEFGGNMNIENDVPPVKPVKPSSVSQRTAQIYAIVTNEIAKARAEGRIGVNENLNVDGVVAQILLESDNGNSRLAKSANNFGGLVADDNWKGPKSESGKYRKYATPEEGLAAQVGFYLDNPRYRKNGVLNATTAEEHFKAVQRAGYAEAPDYVQKSMGMVNSIPKRLKDAGYVAGTQPVAQEQVVTAPVKQSSDIVIPDALPILHAQPIEIKPNFVSEPTTTVGTGGGEATLQTPTIAPLESTVPKGWFGSGKSLFLDKTSPFNYGGTMNPIHINPENKGKFNATKARTGKTTEELTHSPNALTRKRAIFAQNASRWNHQYGGYMFAEGGNLDPLTTFEAGGKHGENPLGGIPQGQNAQGGMNLVEEGETKLNSKDYIFSDTLKVDKDTVAEFNLPKTMIGKTFADASKKMNRPDSRRINDSIEEKAKERDLNALMEAQEVFKEKEVAKKMEEIQSLNPGLFEQMQQAQMAQMQPQGQPQPSPEEMMMMQQGQPPMDPAMQQQMDPAMMEQMAMQQQGIPQQYGGQMSYKCGGSMYDFGGKLGEGIKNYGLGIADTTMSYLGMDNVIKDDQYEGFGADLAKGYSNVVGGIGKAVLPMAANMIVPGSGAAISGAQQLGSMVNPEQEQEQIAQMGGMNFKYGGTFDMPRQQMYMPLDHVTEMGGPRDIQYDGITNPTGFMSTPERRPLNATLDNPYLNTRSEWDLNSTVGQDGVTTKSGEFDNLDPTLESKQTAFNMKETPGQFIGSNIAPAYNIYQGLFGKIDKTPTAGEMFKGVDPYRMNINPAIRATEQAYASAAKDYKNSAGSAGEYLAGRSNLATQEAMNKSALNAQAENAYGQAKMQTDMFNSQGMSAAKLKEYEFALAAKAAKQNYLQEGLKQVGDKTAAQQAQQAGLMYANIHGGGNFQVDYTPYTRQLMSIFGNK